VVNIGNTESWTLREIAETLVAAATTSGPESPIEMVPWPPELTRIDIGDFATDPRRAAELLGWRPATSLADAATDTVRFYRQNPWYLSST
jgi:nucleoside-diphosphate-sugar epimerase